MGNQLTSSGSELGWRVGQLVRDERTGRTGRLMDLGPWHDPASRREYEVAFLRPVGGGREWTTHPARMTPVESPLGEGR